MFYLLIKLLQMILIRKINDLNKAIRENHNLGFVPTMGGLHNGHKSLIKKSKTKCEKTIVSIFVNPKQFNSNNDYQKYPRNLNKDLKMLKKLKTDFVFLPTASEIYKNKKIKNFILKKTQKILCAKYRKGHFEGVLNVMNRFVNIIRPKYIFMGEKDFQQLFLVKIFLEQIYKTKIVPCKTIRSNNKVALSSRNYLLNKKNLIISSYIAKKIIEIKPKISKNKHKSNFLIKKLKIDFLKKFKIKIDYLETRNTKNLTKNILRNDYRIFIAYYINNIRLIDNF